LKIVHTSEELETTARLIPVTQLLEKQAQMWANRYQTRIDIPRAKFIEFLRQEGCEVKLAPLNGITGVALTQMNTERGGQYCWNELYQTTKTDYDKVYASAVANELFLANPLLKTTIDNVIDDARSMGLTVVE